MTSQRDRTSLDHGHGLLVLAEDGDYALEGEQHGGMVASPGLDAGARPLVAAVEAAVHGRPGPMGR